MTKLDEELERLSKAAEEARKLREGSQLEPGTDEWLAENNAIWFAEEVFLTALEAAYRTGQLVPAQPSGDVVEAVAREALLTALHDAINAPKGVVPASAEAFYDPTQAALRAQEAGDV